MEFFHVTQELSNLVWLGLTAIVLQIERTRHVAMLVDMMAAPHSVLTIPERLSHFAEILEPDIPGTGKHFFIKLDG